MPVTPEDVLSIDLTQYDMRDVAPEDLPPMGDLTDNQRASLVRMASVFSYVSVATAISAADALVTYPVTTVEQAFQILVRERDNRREESFKAKVASNKEIPPTSQEINDLNALVNWAADSGNSHLVNVARSRFEKAYLDEGFNKSYFLGTMSAIRGLARGYGLVIPKTLSSDATAEGKAAYAAAHGDPAETQSEEPF